MQDIHALFDQVLPIVRRAGAYVRTATPLTVNEKRNHTDLVTEYDVNTQRMLIEQLTILDPDAKFVGEEEHKTAETAVGDCFVIDPIDGTTNFVKGYGRSAVSVALLRDGKQAFGIVYNPYKDEIYTAIKGEGAFMNGKAIHVSEASLHDSVVNFGTAPYYPELTQRTFRILDKVMKTAVDIRRFGSSALDLCDVACGRGGAFFELCLSPWDHAAGGLIVTEAGGVISDGNGNPLTFEGPGAVLAGGKTAWKELLDIITSTK